MDTQYAKDLIVQDIIYFLMSEENMSMESAMETVYNSLFFEKLSDDETGLYFQSSDYNYELLQNEIKTGRLC